MFESTAYAMGAPMQQAGAQAPNPFAPFIFIIIFFVIWYFLLIRPQSKRQKEHDKMVAGLKKNDEVITTGGIHGTIVNIKDKTFMLRVDDNVKIEISKSVVAALKNKAESA